MLNLPSFYFCLFYIAMTSISTMHSSIFWPRMFWKKKKIPSMHSVETFGRRNILAQQLFQTMLRIAFQNLSCKIVWTHWQVSG